MATARPDPEGVSLEAKVAFLSDPASYPDGLARARPRDPSSDLGRKRSALPSASGSQYPERPGRVERIETHMSWVFLLEADAYKLKKPARRAFLDFSTIAARRWNALEEVRLNRRLAPDTYLGVVPLAERPGGLALGGRGRVVDWLVHMRRLPADRMLDRVLVEGRATEAEARALGTRLADFYRDAEPVAVAPGRHVARIAADVHADAVELRAPGGGLPARRVATIERAVLALVEQERPALEARAREHRIVEGHGDLRPEHVALVAPPVEIDCLEFNRAFRVLDPLEELAFFSLECELLGGAWFAATVVSVYAALTGDPAPARLLHLHASVRALLRAKLALWHLREPTHGADARWQTRALVYLERAAEHARAGRAVGVS